MKIREYMNEKKEVRNYWCKKCNNAYHSKDGICPDCGGKMTKVKAGYAKKYDNDYGGLAK